MRNLFCKELTKAFISRYQTPSLFWARKGLLDLCPATGEENGDRYENQEFAQGAESPSPRQPLGSPQRTCLHHQ